MKHFLAISDLSSGEVQDLLDLAIKLKAGLFYVVTTTAQCALRCGEPEPELSIPD